MSPPGSTSTAPSETIRLGGAVVPPERRRFPKHTSRVTLVSSPASWKAPPVLTRLRRTATRSTIAVGAVAMLSVGMAAPAAAANGLPDLADPLAY